jgi:hypothetical protein
MENSRNEKEGEIGGVHSKLYFRDWILGFVRKNPIIAKRVKEEGDKYGRVTINNWEQVQEFFTFEVSSQRQVKRQQLDILKEVDNLVSQSRHSA